MRISYVVPVHNEENVLRDTTEALVQRLANHPGSEVILVENGSTDGSSALVEELERELTRAHVKVIAAFSRKGMGNAYREGLRHAGGDLIVLTAADLPFGFSDLDEVLARRPAPVSVGSKAHSDSVVEVGWPRRALSWGFMLVRRALVGLPVRDSQGTILIEGELARDLLPRLACEDYLIATELLAVAAASGARIAEVPVVYRDARADSRVRPLHDAVAMLRGLLRLRRRLRANKAGE